MSLRFRATSSRTVAVLAVAFAAGLLISAGAVLAQQGGQADQPDLEITDQNFGWVGADEEAGTAQYAWAVAVMNNEETEDHDVQVILQLVDSSENVVHTDTTTTTVGATEQEQVKAQGSVTIEVAKKVASYRNALRVVQSESR